MHAKPVAILVAMTGGLPLGAAAGIGWAHDKAEHRPAHQVHGSIPEAQAQAQAEDTAPSGATVIERTLGDGPAGTIVVNLGTTVRLVLHAPAGIELHLHGYNLAETATDAAPVVMTLHADHAGRFPIGAHGVQDLLGRTDRALAYLEVRPE